VYVAGSKLGAEGVEDMVFAGAGDLQLNKAPGDLLYLGGLVLDGTLLMLVVRVAVLLLAMFCRGPESREEGLGGEWAVLEYGAHFVNLAVLFAHTATAATRRSATRRGGGLTFGAPSADLPRRWPDLSRRVRKRFGSLPVFMVVQADYLTSLGWMCALL
jgi:hypothetical protein